MLRRQILPLLLVLPVLAAAQAPRRTPQGLQAATRAILEGRYDEVETLTEKLDARDPAVAALRGRAAIARGRYADAEALLRPVANRAPTSEAALELGLLQHMLRRMDAAGLLGKVASLANTSDDPMELMRAGRALRALGRFPAANAAYRDAVAAAPKDPQINTEWGELFLDTYNKSDAIQSFQTALKSDPRWTPAIVGTARSLEEDDPPQAAAIAKKALEINPFSVEAHVFLAGKAAEADHHDEARSWLEKALFVNPSSLEARSLVAALAYVEDRLSDFEAEVAKTLAIAPKYGDVYRTAGALAAHNYRFDEAVDLTRRGLALDPGNPRGLADLGSHLLRTGDEAAARVALEASFKTDPYDVATFNMLGLLDTLDKFETIRDGDIILKMSKDEAPVLKEAALSLAHQALKSFSARYEFTPQGPILIEVFPRHDDFAVRTVGLPGMVGALGACFGRVVTMDSPLARPGEFQWEATLWHELAHVITIQMSNQRVPRWLTEGISVYEENLARPDWQRQGSVQFAAALNQGQAPKLRDLNAAFTDPKMVSLAYFQGALIVEHIVDVYGMEGLRKLVRIYAKGLNTDAALKAALDTDFDRMQSGFDEMVARKFGSIRKALVPPPNSNLTDMKLPALQQLATEHPGSFPVQMALGRALQEAKELDEALKAYERAAKLIPMPAGKDSPRALSAAIAIEKKDTARAISELQALLAVDFDNVGAARRLAALLVQAGVKDPATLRPVYERIVAIDPYDVDAQGILGRLAIQRNDPEAAARAFRTVLALKPVDRAAAITDLAESYLKAGKNVEAKRQTLAALEIAPSYERAQDLLLKLIDARR
jgi:tetratricopeptide (TPR) repeat protein